MSQPPLSARQSVASNSSNPTSSFSSSSSAATSNPGVNVGVVVRCRPMNETEKAELSPVSVVCSSSRREVQASQLVAGKEATKSFHYDCVMGPSATQQDVYENAVRPLVEEVLKGFNCTVFVYGQTGTGKTFTMEGDRRRNSVHSGVIPRSVHHIFEALEQGENDYSVRVSFIELYNEDLHDLLATEQKPMRLFEERGLGCKVSPLEELPVANADEIFTILDASYQKRITAETALNKASSRSHCIFTLTLHMKETGLDGEEFLKVGKLNLVDLAGSESIGRSKAVNQRAREAGMINQSLLTLGRVITSLTEHNSHIPYRESKLTRLLQESLGGRAKTCIIATISPAANCIEETMNTLDYAYRAKNIKNKPEVNQKMTKKTLIKEYVGEIEKLKMELLTAREKGGVYLPFETFRGMETQIKSMREQITDLEAQIELKEKTLSQIKILFDTKEVELNHERTAHSATKGELSQTSQNLEICAHELSETRKSLHEKTVLLSEHQKTEENLHAEGSQLMACVAESTNDIHGLFAKIDRKASVEQSNMAAIQETNSKLYYVIQQAEKTSQNLNKALDEMSVSYIHRLNEFVENRTKAAQQQSSETQQKCHAVLGLVERIHTAYLSMCQGSLSSSAEAIASVQQLCLDISSNMNEMIEAADFQAVDISRCVQTEREHIEGWISAQRSIAEQYMSQTLSTTRSYLDQVTKIQSTLSMGMKEQESKLLEEKLIHAAQLKENKERTERMKTQFANKLQELQSAVFSEIDTNEEVMTSSATQYQNRTEMQLSSLRKTHTESQGLITQSLEHIQNIESDCKAYSQTAMGQLDSLSSFVRSSESQKNEKISDISRSLSQFRDKRIHPIFSEQQNKIQRLGEAEQLRIAANREEIQGMLQAVAEQNQSLCVQSRESASENYNKDITFCENEQSHASQSKDARDQVTATVTHHNATALKLVENYGSNLRVDTPTGATPKKKQYTYPTALSTTRPHHEILVALYSNPALTPILQNENAPVQLTDKSKEKKASHPEGRRVVLGDVDANVM